MDRNADDGLLTHPNLHALWRFRWLVVLGVCVAALVPMLMLYKAKVSWPPHQRSRPVYVARTQLLVNSPTGPFLRTQPKVVGSQPRGSQTGTVPSSTQTVVPSASDTKSLVDAANLFPLLVTSDKVAAVRTRLIGTVRGTVTAKALFSTQGANRYRPSTVPAMEIVAVARRPKPAVRLAEGTARAFEIWLASEQTRAHVPPNQRIVLRPLQAATGATRTGGAGLGLPILVAFAVLAAFIGGAIAR